MNLTVVSRTTLVTAVQRTKKVRKTVVSHTEQLMSHKQKVQLPSGSNSTTLLSKCNLLLPSSRL